MPRTRRIETHSIHATRVKRCCCDVRVVTRRIETTGSDRAGRCWDGWCRRTPRYEANRNAVPRARSRSPVRLRRTPRYEANRRTGSGPARALLSVRRSRGSSTHTADAPATPDETTGKGRTCGRSRLDRAHWLQPRPALPPDLTATPRWRAPPSLHTGAQGRARHTRQLVAPRTMPVPAR
jgi:hypothetical protein